MIIASWSGLLGNSWPKQLKLVAVCTIGDHCVCQRVALDWGKVFEMPWLVNIMSNQVDLPGHCSSGRTYWTGSGAVGTSQKDCCRRFCQVPECCFWKKLATKKRTCLWFSRSGAQAFKVETVTLLRPISAVYYLATTWADVSMSDWFFLVEFLYIYVMICIWSKINL